LGINSGAKAEKNQAKKQAVFYHYKYSSTLY